MANKFFQSENEQEDSTVHTVRDTLVVSDSGDVTFRTRRGRGTGKSIEIAGDEFDEFVDLMNQVARRRNTRSALDNTEVTSDSSDSSEE